MSYQLCYITDSLFLQKSKKNYAIHFFWFLGVFFLILLFFFVHAHCHSWGFSSFLWKVLFVGACYSLVVYGFICQVHQSGCYLYFVVMLPGLSFPNSNKKMNHFICLCHLAVATGKLYFSTWGRDITTALSVLGQQQGQVMETEEEVINRTPHHSGVALVWFI